MLVENTTFFIYNGIVLCFSNIHHKINLRWKDNVLNASDRFPHDIDFFIPGLFVAAMFSSEWSRR